MRAIINENIEFNKRVRLIIGLNEETNWKCIERYKKTEENPTISFSPDGCFPCVYAEKGFLTITLKQKINQENSNICIEEIDCKENPVNVVPRTCEVLLKVKNNIDEIFNLIKNEVSNNTHVDVIKIEMKK